MTTTQTFTDAWHWNLDVAALVPEEYAVYRPVVTDALASFVGNLSAPRQAEILAEQQRLDASTSLAQRFAAVLRQCPTLHKLGQVVARNRQLSPALRTWLQTLESMEPVTPMASITPIIERELGARGYSTLQIAPEALAEASVAVVVPFTFKPANREEPSEGVLKILKPGIDTYLEEELAIWGQLGLYIDDRCDHYRVPPLRYAETLNTVRELLANEIQLDLEQQHLSGAAELYSNTSFVEIPRLLPFCTPRITAMSRVHGSKVTALEHLPKKLQQSTANKIIRALITQPIWTPKPSVMFHADPHAGNMLLTDEHRIALLDWSLVGHLSKTDRVQTMQIMLGALTMNGPHISRGVAALAAANPDESRLRAVVDQGLRRLTPGKLPGFNWLVRLLDDSMLSAGVQFGKDLLLFRKSILTIEGLLQDVSPDNTIDRALPLAAAWQFSKEWPYRAFSPPLSRQFGTHLSNLDLLSLYWGAPATAVRYWRRLWEEGPSSNHSEE